MKEVEVIVLLLFSIAFIASISSRYKIPLPIFLVIAGLLISIIPGIHVITLNSEIIFPLFLPPLLYYTAWNISWCTFKLHIRTILLASISLVFFTVFAIGSFIHFLIPALGWPIAILLGAILSPPDAVAATSLTKGLGLQPRLLTILEGESLLNDASALVAFKYALDVIIADSFSISDVASDFALVFLGGIGVGFIIGYLLSVLQTRFVRDSIISVSLMLVTPFASYLLAERLHLSGILAVVTTGLYLSFRSDKILTNESRIKGYAVWEVTVFILNSLVFILIGLQLKPILKEFSIAYTLQLLLYSFLIVLAGLAVRFIWTVPNTLLPRMWSKKIRTEEPFDRRNILVFTWAGMKGIVSMTIALSLPAKLPNHQPFPFHYEIIFLTFFVILFSLILQGLTLPLVVKKLKMPVYSPSAEEYEVRSYLLQEMEKHINLTDINVPEEARIQLHQKYKVKQNRIQSTRVPDTTEQNASVTVFNQFTRIELEMLVRERELTYRLRKQGKVTEEILHKIEREIDFEEARIRLELFQQ